ncbi:MAG: phosphatase PAP2 family protein [Clostridiales bacterium]|nr:phosphatase PAP2 family protein [Clostridiales bacterium]
MQFEADIIKLLQRMSNGFSDTVFLGISLLGTEIAFLVIAVALYLCLDKQYAYRFFNVYILSVAINNFLKLGFKRTRPFNAYRVRSIGDPESTYSFPSGHTQSIATVSTLLTIKYGKRYKAVPIIGIAATLLVMLSRMYLGQHYLSDVFCGLTLGVFCAIVFNSLLSLFGDREELFIIPNLILSVIIISVLAGVGMLNSPSGADILKGLGAFVAFDIGYFVEKRYVKYDVTDNREWWTIALRLVVCLGVAVGVQQGFKLFLPESIPLLYCFLRYFIMAAWVSVGAPALYKKLKI